MESASMFIAPGFDARKPPIGLGAIGFAFAILFLFSGSHSQSTWTMRHPYPHANTMHSVIWAGDRFVALKADYSLCSSPDGETWSTAYAGGDFPIHAVAWNGKVLVAVGEWGWVLSTTDFKTWSKVKLDSTFAIHTAAWIGDMFVAAGDYGTLLTSPDGAVWTRQNSGTTQGLNSVARNDSIIVAVGSNGAIPYSRNGIDWTVTETGVENAFLSVLWDGKQFVAAGDTLFVSPDGKQWAARSGFQSDLVRLSVKTADAYYAVGKKIYSSKDLSTWDSVENLGNTLPLRSIAWSGSRLVATGHRGETFLSENGRDWKKVHRGVRQHLLSIAKSESVYVAVGWNGTIVRSIDGVKWDSILVDSTIYELADVNWTGSRFVAVGYPTAILSSRDGIKWEREKANTIKRELHLVFSWNGNTIVIGEGGVVLHPDGAEGWTQTWLKTSSGVDFNAGGAVFANGEVYVAGSYGQIFSSTDGYNWQIRRSYNINNRGIGGLAWNGTEFVGHAGTEFLRSRNGTTWESRNVPDFGLGFIDVAWTGKEFLAVGSAIVRGTDGFNWTPVTWDGKDFLSRILVDGKRIFAVGDDGIILESENDSPVDVFHRLRQPTLDNPAVRAAQPVQGIPFWMRAGRAFLPDGRQTVGKN